MGMYDRDWYRDEYASRQQDGFSGLWNRFRRWCRQLSQ
ncbi:hypothetical protein Pan216_01540 [Planctomycetes bacterium Pan216]|uniref:Uncharacterized protein n=1 Tax=Kolteria novifilia TaxID=2527975 RepID=A0A518AX86_9BACT|nr:hypothetical protein Pan216_01540 [Planctomycetes bacterium Pan216]